MYLTIIQYFVFTDQRKYYRPHDPDVTPYSVGGNGVPLKNCKKALTKYYKAATFNFSMFVLLFPSIIFIKKNTILHSLSYHINSYQTGSIKLNKRAYGDKFSN